MFRCWFIVVHMFVFVFVNVVFSLLLYISKRCIDCLLIHKFTFTNIKDVTVNTTVYIFKFTKTYVTECERQILRSSRGRIFPF